MATLWETRHKGTEADRGQRSTTQWVHPFILENPSSVLTLKECI